MNEEEFIDNATKLLLENDNITKEQADAIANLTIMLEKTCRESSLFHVHF